jgi:hypothetical protein
MGYNSKYPRDGRVEPQPGNSGWHLDLICPIDQHTTGFHGALRMVMHDTASPDAPEIRPVWDKLNQGHAPFMPMANLTCCSSNERVHFQAQGEAISNLHCFSFHTWLSASLTWRCLRCTIPRLLVTLLSICRVALHT